MTPSPPAGLVLPSHGPTSLAGVLPAAATALGAELPADLPRVPLDLDVDGLCVVLVDGLGWHMLRERGGHAPFLRSRLAEAQRLTVGFPSTTAASLGSLGTGRPPGQTGLLGYTVRDPVSGELTNLIGWGGAARPEDWQRCPTVFELLAGSGVGVLSVGKERFRDSGLTVAALRGGDFAGADELADRVDVAVAALRGRRRSLVYLYWGDVDTVGHHRGWGSWEWGEQVEAVDRELARLAAALPPRTAMLVTADHGMVDVGPRDRVDVAVTPALAEDVEMVAGEPRAVHVYCARGTAARVAARWQDVLGQTGWVLTREEAEELGLLGPVTPRHRPAIGDVVVATRGTRAVVDSRTQSATSLELVGMHGSLTPAEMVVPLVVERR